MCTPDDCTSFLKFGELQETWGDDTSEDLREIDTEQLVAMHDHITDAVQLSYEDNVN